MEPCPICAWAIEEAKIGRVVLGARHAGKRRTDYGNYSIEKLIAMTCSSFDVIDVIDGVWVEDCEAVRRGRKNWVEPRPSQHWERVCKALNRRAFVPYDRGQARNTYLEQRHIK